MVIRFCYNISIKKVRNKRKDFKNETITNIYKR